MAETTTATSWPASTSRLTWRATLRMRSRSATDVPPNFITRRAMTSPDAPKGANKRPAQSFRAPKHRPAKARIHTGEVGDLQLEPAPDARRLEWLTRKPAPPAYMRRQGG